MGDLTVQEKFEEKIKNKLRSDIGDLIPDEVLATMTTKALKELFFEKRTIPSSGYGDPTTKPSWFEEEVERLLNKNMQGHIVSYIEKNKDELEKQLAEEMAKLTPTFIAKLFTGAMAGLQTGVSSAVSQMFYNMQNNITKY